MVIQSAAIPHQLRRLMVGVFSVSYFLASFELSGSPDTSRRFLSSGLFWSKHLLEYIDGGSTNVLDG